MSERAYQRRLADAYERDFESYRAEQEHNDARNLLIEAIHEFEWRLAMASHTDAVQVPDSKLFVVMPVDWIDRARMVIDGEGRER